MMKGSKTIRKAVSCVSAFAVTVGLCALFSGAAVHAEETDTDAAGSLIGALSYTYADYVKDCEANGAAAYTGKDIVFGPDNAVADTTEIREQDGSRAAVSGEAHPRLTFRVAVPQTGMYRLTAKYIFPIATGFNGSRKLLIDGESVCLESDNIAFYRIFQDDGEPRTNALGDQVKPTAKEILSWQTTSLTDNMGRCTDPLTFYLTAGEHELTFVYDKQELLIAEIALCAPETHPSYAEYIRGAAADITGYHGRVQAEDAMVSRNDPAIGLASDGDPCVVPSEPGYLLMNTVGGYTYREGGQSVTFAVTVDKAGYAAFGTAKITGFERLHDSSLKDVIKNAYVGVAEGYQSEDLVYKITLDKKLGFKVGDHITSLDRIGSGTTVKNSTFGYNTGRCIVVKGHDVVIENNTLAYSCNSAIYALADLNWCESGFPQNVRISGNKIENCNTSGVHLNSGRGDAGAIRLDILPTSNVSGFMNNYNNKNITVSNNTITASRVYGIFATNCDGIKITGNTIDRPFVNGIAKVGQSYGLSPVGGLFVGMSKNVTVTDNTVIGGGKITQAVEIYKNCTGTIKNSNNTLR